MVDRGLRNFRFDRSKKLDLLGLAELIELDPFFACEAKLLNVA